MFLFRRLFGTSTDAPDTNTTPTNDVPVAAAARERNDNAMSRVQSVPVKNCAGENGEQLGIIRRRCPKLRRSAGSADVEKRTDGPDGERQTNGRPVAELVWRNTMYKAEPIRCTVFLLSTRSTGRGDATKKPPASQCLDVKGYASLFRHGSDGRKPIASRDYEK